MPMPIKSQWVEASNTGMASATSSIQNVPTKVLSPKVPSQTKRNQSIYTWIHRQGVETITSLLAIPTFHLPGLAAKLFASALCAPPLSRTWRVTRHSKDKCCELEEELRLKINEHIPLTSISRCCFKSSFKRLHETIWNISQCFHGSSPPPSTHTEWRLSQWDLRTFSSAIAILAKVSFHKCKPKDYDYIMTLVCAYDCCNFSPNSQIIKLKTNNIIQIQQMILVSIDCHSKIVHGWKNVTTLSTLAFALHGAKFVVEHWPQITCSSRNRASAGTSHWQYWYFGALCI